MIIKKATQVGDPIIRAKAKAVPIKSIGSKKINTVIKNLTDSMTYLNLVGMAAPQIGLSLRIFVSEIKSTKNRKPKDVDPLRIFINPKIISFSKQKVAGYEGCGSVAHGDLFGLVTRPKSVTVEALDAKGKKFVLKATGLLARIIQHETDHLNGIIFLDRLTDTKSLMGREEYRKKFRK